MKTICELCHNWAETTTICVGIGVYWAVCPICRTEAEAIATDRQAKSGTRDLKKS